MSKQKEDSVYKISDPATWSKLPALMAEAGLLWLQSITNLPKACEIDLYYSPDRVGVAEFVWRMTYKGQVFESSHRVADGPYYSEMVPATIKMLAAQAYISWAMHVGFENPSHDGREIARMPFIAEAMKSLPDAPQAV